MRIYERVCDVHEYRFKHVDDLARVHAARVERELALDNLDEALALARRAVADPAPDAPRGPTRLLHRRSLRLWNLALDLEESLNGDEGVAVTRAAYERCLRLKVATPAVVANYAAFLKDHGYFEDGLAAHEKGLALFPPPHEASAALWRSYLDDFVERYRNTQIVRARELFERCLAAPHDPSHLSVFHLKYAAYERDHAKGPSSTKRLLSIHERMCTAVPLKEKRKAYQLYALHATKLLGPTAARPVYVVIFVTKKRCYRG